MQVALPQQLEPLLLTTAAQPPRPALEVGLLVPGHIQHQSLCLVSQMAVTTVSHL